MMNTTMEVLIMPLNDLEREKLNQMIMSKMQDTSNFDEAMQSENQSNLLSNMGEAAEGLFKARSMAVGGQGVDTPFYKNLRDQAGQRTQSEAEKTSQGLKSLMFQKMNLDKKGEAAQAAEERDYQRGQDATKNLFETQKMELMRNRGNSSDSPFEIRTDEFGRLIKVDKSGRGELIKVDQNGTQNSGIASSQMEADVNQPPKPMPGENREQYKSRIRQYNENQSRNAKKEAEMPELEVGNGIYAKTKEDAKILKEGIVGADAAIQDLTDIKNIGTNVSMLDVQKRGLIQQKIMTSIGKLRLSVLGPGAMTDGEREYLRENIGDPSKLFSTESNEKAKLDQLISDIEKSKQREIQIRTRNQTDQNQGQQMPAQQQPQQLTDEDRQALDWAKSNPNDPRSKSIIESFSK
jgi:hypothetical protein